MDTPVDVESLGALAPSTPGVHEFIHSVQFGIMPKRLPLPHSDDEILCGNEEGVLSIQDGDTAWVLVDPASFLERHLVSEGSAKPKIVIPKTGGTVHPIQSIALTTTCLVACVSRRASAF